MTEATLTTERPRRRDGVVVHQADDPAQPWVVEVDDGRYLRVGRDAGRLLDRLDGRLEPDAIAADLGRPWTGDLVRATVERFGKAGLLEDGAAVVATATKPLRRNAAGQPARLQYRPPASLQLTVVNPDSWLERHRALCRRLTGPAAAAAAVLVGLVGLLALAARSDVVAGALSRPLSVPTLAAAIAAFVFAMSLHELAHAATLGAGGGRVRRMGVMLLYLTPAFFCDVTDGWRLPERRDRVRVALAGGTANVAIAGLVAIASLAASGAVQSVLIVVAVTTYGGAVVNLLPLVKFDGYIALMSALDIPHLRARAMTDWRRVAGRVLFGGDASPASLPGLWWAPWYGLACAVAPIVIVGLAGWNIAMAVSGWGVVGAATRLAMAALAVRFVGRRVLALVAAARAGRASLPRVAAGLAALAVIATAVLTVVPVPDVVRGGYVQRGESTVFVTSSARDAARLRPATPVDLERHGMVTHTTVGSAVSTVAGGDVPATASVPLQALVPFLRVSTPAQAHQVPLTGVAFTGAHDVTGGATARIGTTSPGAWLGRAFVSDPTHTIVDSIRRLL